jgi:hypothetical protein
MLRVSRALCALGFVLLSALATAPAMADDNQVEFNGTVTSMPPSGLIGDWTIGGKTVHVDSSTEIDQENGAIGVGATVKVEGATLMDGSIRASQIKVVIGVGPPPPGGGGEGDDNGETEFTGAIQSLPAGGLIGIWTIAGKQVQVVSTTRLEQENGGFAIGTIVEVEGLAGASGVIVASKIEVVGDGTPAPQPPPNELEITGTIESLPAGGLIGNWQVSGRTVIVTSSTELDAENGAFAVGVTVKVEGSLDPSGNVLASEIESKPGNGADEPALDFFGTINALPSGPSGLVGVWNVDGKLVNVTASTVIDTGNGPVVVGAIVEVEGWLQPDGMIEAQKIETQSAVGDMAGVGPAAVEFFNAQLGHFFVTASTAEIAALDAGAFGGAWQRTGQTFNVGGTAVVCRFYGMPPKGPDSHFFTANPAECSNVMTQFAAWTFEGHAFAITPATNGQCPAGLVSVNRFFNNPTTVGAMNHRFTVTQQAFDQTVAMGWVNEGVVMCAQP